MLLQPTLLKNAGCIKSNLIKILSMLLRMFLSLLTEGNFFFVNFLTMDWNP